MEIANEPVQNPEPDRKSQRKFTHLHLHTSYSLLDGAIRIGELMKHVKASGMDSVAMTDHGNMFGAIEFYKAAKKNDVKPIIGLEFYVAPGSMKETKQMDRLVDGNNYHLILLAKNKKGYENLIKLASRSYTDGFYRKPRIDYELLAAHSEGLIGSSACIAGEIQRRIIDGKMDEAARLAGQMNEIFGKDHFYLEIQKHGIQEEEVAARGNLELSRRLDIPMVLTNDSHFLTPNDREAQDILLRINQKKTIDDHLAFGFNREFYVKNPDEMWRLFPEIPDAFHNTTRIAEMVDLDFTFGNPLLPKFEVPQGEDLATYMRKLALEGLKRRYADPLPREVLERFEFEYDVIIGMDFPGYFLIVQDFINWAKSQGIPVGPGRGSAAGSIVAYGLGITDIDPLKYDLLFERFLNPDRKEMPDIDVDFCTERREEVIQYCRDKYGSEQVGQIITYGTLAAKACLKDVARVLNFSFDEANAISKKFPDVLGITIDEALEKSSELKEYADSGENQKHLFEVARKLEGNVRHTGVHAAGVVIAPQPLEELVPLATVAAKSADRGSFRVPVCQYDMTALTDVGLVKMDFLGLRNLTIINDALEEIERRHGTRLDFETISLEDRKTYEILKKGDVAGVFQLESAGMREFVLRTKPDKFEDIIALIALFRPGPLQAGMSDSFINRKNGKEKLTFPHADLEPVLRDTYGVIVYQEQVMLISRVIGGFTPGESDGLRKAMGKKKMELVNQMKVQFLEGAQKKGYDAKWAEGLYDQMAEFAKYGFNKSHSAAYAMIVYRTAYLKANYPVEYMRAVLDSEIDRTERLVFYINACRDMGIQILAPDVNQSGLRFTVIDDKTIRFGLTAVKNVGEPAARSILEARQGEGGNFSGFLSIAENVDLRICNRRALEALVHAGAFTGLGYTRKALLESIELVLTRAQKTQADRASGQESLFGAMSGMDGAEQDPIPRGDDVAELPDQILLLNEKDVLGFYFSGHPLQKYEYALKRIGAPSLQSLKSRRNGEKVEIPGVITEFSIRPTRTGKEMARVTIEDMSGSISAVIFPNQLGKLRPLLQTDIPLMFKATVQKKEETDTVELLVDDIQTLDQDLIDEKQEKSLHLKLKSEKMSEEVIGRLRTILGNHRGNLSVYFHLVDPVSGPTGRTVIKAHDSFSVQYSKDMVNRLRSVEEIEGVYLSVGEQLRDLYKQ